MPLAPHNCAHLTVLAVPAAESSQLVTIQDRKIENGISSPTQSMSPSTQRCAQGRESRQQQQQQHVQRQPPKHPIQQVNESGGCTLLQEKARIQEILCVAKLFFFLTHDAIQVYGHHFCCISFK
ncbi:hypothetical protein XELAEV_18039960mg [Xenopus laevis]|uniref:Uncharacterized protein n=1 Tax=Xenopus laevis TaxID=8355 RepID=A0A974H8H7_XENLA|nr:hypothetical protein XELAEV_18039960mg [Xenopus laevis]